MGKGGRKFLFQLRFQVNNLAIDLFLDILKKVNLFFGENLGLKRLATGQKMF